MMAWRRSLRWRITLGLMVFQIVILVVAAAVSVGFWFNASSSGVIVSGSAIRAVAASVVQDEQGNITLSPTPELRAFQERDADLWFVARVTNGEMIDYGPVPAVAREAMADAPRIKTLDLRGDDPRLIARFENVSRPDGQLAVMLGGGGFISEFAASLLLGAFVIFIPTAILILLTLIGVPPFIRFNLRGVLGLSRQMEGIDFQTRGTRLSLEGLPEELLPVVRAMNEALRRLDTGFEVTERFFMNAAHELRTPIAILQVRLDALPPGEERDKLMQIIRRLSALARQLLEIERMRQSEPNRQPVDLGAILSNAVADLAPYAVTGGYDLSLDKPDDPVWVMGDPESLDRMAVNLIQNAVQHGGGRGAISVRLNNAGVIDVTDEGPGIPSAKRETVFEPFVRLNPHGAGSGLGLKMVRDIARAHGGDAIVAASSGNGTTMRITLPLWDEASPDARPKKRPRPHHP